MNIKELKKYIYENERIIDVLEALGCHRIKDNFSYIQCCNPDGDNPTAICVYKNEWLSCVNYTRDMSEFAICGKLDIISLVQFIKNTNFVEATRFCCGVVGLDYYHDFNKELPQSLQILKLISEMDNGTNEQDECVKPRSEKLLSYYKPFTNKLFKEDNISYETQREFEVGFDEETNRITIPIRGEDGSLLGVKGRLFVEDKEQPKYLYLEKLAKGKVLYGLYKTLPYISREREVYVFESEKAAMQAWGYGDKNCVATGGKTISQTQVDMLTRLCTKVVFAFDKDVSQEEIISRGAMFQPGVSIEYIYDEENILLDKESPTDSKEKWNELKHKRRVVVI